MSLSDTSDLRIIPTCLRSSSMVEQEAVNFEVAGSSPASGAKIIVPAKGWGFYFDVLGTRTSNRKFGH